MITNAGDLWNTWVASKTLRPQDYDKDLADELESRLTLPRATDPSKLADRLNAAGWTPRELIRFMTPHLASFSAMLKDLLALYTRIVAVSADGENLRVSYEFDEGHPVDVELHAFRETIERLELSLSQIDQFVFPTAGDFLPCPFGNHSRRFSELQDRGSRVTGISLDAFRRHAIPNTCPLPDMTGDHEIDLLSVRHRQMIDAVIGIAQSYGATSAGIEGPPGSFSFHPAHLPLTDCWLAVQIGLNQHLTAGGVVADAMTSPESRRTFSAWLDTFWEESTVEEEVLVEHVTNVLSLPEWGQRHDLYAAWIASQFDAALPSEHFKFRVENGTLSFPFKGTHLATLETPDGPVELWCELRQPATGPLSGGRKAGVQPDYLFLEARTRRPLVAVEVKQYRRAAATRHRATMLDYLRNLPDAIVVLVGHGPLGRTIDSKLPVHLRPRARVHDRVQPGEAIAQPRFQGEIAALLPTAGALAPSFPADGSVATRLTLAWEATKHDLELSILTQNLDFAWLSRKNPVNSRAELVVSCADGCPQVVDLLAASGDDALIFVRLVDGVSPIIEAAPRLTILDSDGSTRTLVPSGLGGTHKGWVVGWWDGVRREFISWLSEDAPAQPRDGSA